MKPATDVKIEESTIARPDPWAVIVNRAGEPIPRTLWARYATLAEAIAGEREALRYLLQRGEGVMAFATPRTSAERKV